MVKVIAMFGEDSEILASDLNLGDVGVVTVVTRSESGVTIGQVVVRTPGFLQVLASDRHMNVDGTAARGLMVRRLGPGDGIVFK